MPAIRVSIHLEQQIIEVFELILWNTTQEGHKTQIIFPSFFQQLAGRKTTISIQDAKKKKNTK